MELPKLKTNSLDVPFYKSTEMIQLLDTRIPDTHTTESQRLDFDNVWIEHTELSELI